MLTNDNRPRVRLHTEFIQKGSRGKKEYLETSTHQYDSAVNKSS